ncbi:MAG: anthranilate phosphoribosyltransferase, partial [Sphingobacteriales bacterium]
YNEAELAAFITVFLMRTITIDELQGFRDGLLELALPVNLEAYKPVDIVGTGGDGKNTFNISTLACLVVAGTGTKVAKHGNYGASSISGASNVMETLGYRFRSNNDQLERELETAGFTFLHAPLFHPALKAVGGIRRNLGFRTFFNMLGPLVNPARPAYQLIGVYSPELLRIYNYLLQQGEARFTLIHGLDGYDEVSLTNDTKVITPAGEQIRSAVELGKRTVQAADISGGASVEEAARIFRKILQGEGSWAQNAVVLANAALSLHGSGGYASYEDAYDAAVESLESGRARNVLETLISLQ